MQGTWVWSLVREPESHISRDMPKKKKQAWGKRQELPSPLQRSHPPRNFICSPIWKLSEPHAFGFLIATSLLRQSWLNHWPLMIELSLQPLTFLEVGGRPESSNSLIRYLVFLTSRHLNVIFWIVNFFLSFHFFLIAQGSQQYFCLLLITGLGYVLKFQFNSTNMYWAHLKHARHNLRCQDREMMDIDSVFFSLTLRRYTP